LEDAIRNQDLNFMFTPSGLFPVPCCCPYERKTREQLFKEFQDDFVSDALSAGCTRAELNLPELVVDWDDDPYEEHGLEDEDERLPGVHYHHQWFIDAGQRRADRNAQQ
jgi:hypothetical protein